MKEELECVNKILTKSESTLLNNYIDKLRKQIDQTEELAMEYKTIIDKAIEYINRLEEDYDVNVYQEDKHWAYILYVLQGEDNE